MPRVLILVLFFTILSLFTLNAVLALFWPDKFIRLQDWISRANRYSKPNPDWQPGHMWNIRGAGLGTLLVILFALLQQVIFWGVHSPSTIQQNHAPAAIPTHGVLSELLIGATFLLASAYLAFHPRAVTRWIVRHNPHRIFPPDVEERNVWAIRGFFILGMAFGGFVLYVALTMRP